MIGTAAIPAIADRLLSAAAPSPANSRHSFSIE
jgi:hypothetical protein